MWGKTGYFVNSLEEAEGVWNQDLMYDRIRMTYGCELEAAQLNGLLRTENRAARSGQLQMPIDRNWFVSNVRIGCFAYNYLGNAGVDLAADELSTDNRSDGVCIVQFVQNLNMKHLQSAETM